MSSRQAPGGHEPPSGTAEALPLERQLGIRSLTGKLYSGVQFRRGFSFFCGSRVSPDRDMFEIGRVAEILPDIAPAVLVHEDVPVVISSHQVVPHPDVMLELLREVYGGKFEPVQSMMVRDLYDLLEKIIDRCRDAGNAISHIVLKNS